MSPEQVRGEPVDARSDIFSFGLVLYECLSGRAPFERQTGAELMTAILREDPPELPETVSPALRQIVQHCLEKEPERRFHSANDLGFRAAHGEHLEHRIAEQRADGSAQSAPRTRKWMWPALVAALLAALLAAFAIPHFLELDPIDLAAYRFIPFANDHEAENGAGVESGRQEHRVFEDGRRHAAVDGARAWNRRPPIQLTKSKARVTQAFWSPDSRSGLLHESGRKGRACGASALRAGMRRRSWRICGPRIFRRTARRWRSGGRRKRAATRRVRCGSLRRRERRRVPYQPAPFEIPLESAGQQRCTFRRMENRSC